MQTDVLVIHDLLRAVAQIIAFVDDQKDGSSRQNSQHRDAHTEAKAQARRGDPG